MDNEDKTLSTCPLKFLSSFFFFCLRECCRVSLKSSVIYQLLMKGIVGDVDFLVQLANLDDIIYNINSRHKTDVSSTETIFLSKFNFLH